MSKKGLLLIPVVAVLLLAQNCGHDQQLTSITVQPATQTFGDPNTPVSANAGLSVQLSAMGTYTHPPVTKDITDQVTWTSNTPGMVTVTPKGLITPTGTSCGTTVVSATVTTNHSSGNISSSGALVTGSMTAMWFATQVPLPLFSKSLLLEADREPSPVIHRVSIAQALVGMHSYPISRLP